MKILDKVKKLNELALEYNKQEETEGWIDVSFVIYFFKKDYNKEAVIMVMNDIDILINTTYSYFNDGKFLGVVNPYHSIGTLLQEYNRDQLPFSFLKKKFIGEIVKVGDRWKIEFKIKDGELYTRQELYWDSFILLQANQWIREGYLENGKEKLSNSSFNVSMKDNKPIITSIYPLLGFEYSIEDRLKTLKRKNKDLDKLILFESFENTFDRVKKTISDIPKEYQKENKEWIKAVEKLRERY